MRKRTKERLGKKRLARYLKRLQRQRDEKAARKMEVVMERRAGGIHDPLLRNSWSTRWYG